MTSINILLVGEAGTGKTALIKKFNDPNYTFTPIGEADYWSYQAAPETLTKEIVINGQKVTLNINEVAGSRGRMGNHYEIMTAVKMADCIGYCYNPVNEWALNSVEYTLQTAWRGLESGKKKTTKKGTKEAKGAQKTLPVTLIQTHSDLPHTTTNGEKIASEKKYKFIQTSALQGTNVDQCFYEMALSVLEQNNATPTVQKTSTTTTTTETNTTTVDPLKMKTEDESVWKKLLAKFLRAEQKNEKVDEKQTTTDQTLASAAPVA